ncbi:histidine phosphatase family protein [Streptomyces sp. NPDC057539]|uniref:histidine phosphatase family protein n=1 Tax=Streptomyces sp. NPDC057539 TaxID=3346159 RepID=UPI0036827EF9
MTRIIFVRHGRTAHNVAMVITSAAPGAPLDDTGRDQALKLAGELAGEHVDAIYTSPLTRAAQTADILAAELGTGPVHVHPDLRECSVGDLEGASGPEAFARFDGAIESWHLRSDLARALGSGGESGTEAVERVRRVVAEIESRHEGTVVVVSHSTVLQIALPNLCENLPASYGHRRWIANAGYVDTRPTETGRTCATWSGTTPGTGE